MQASTKIEWTFTDDDSKWTGPESPPPDARRWRWRTILTFVVTVIISVVTITLFLHHRIAHNQRQLIADIQALIDLEARAIASGDHELFPTLIDHRDTAWLEQQKNDFNHFAQNPDEWPHPKVIGVQLVDNYIWVQVRGRCTGSDNQCNWTRFYRWVDNGWRHAAPDIRYWGTAQERDIGPFHFLFHTRDDPYIEPLAADLTILLTPLCDDLDCPADQKLTVQLTLPAPHSQIEPQEPDAIVLPSVVNWPQPTDARLQIPSLDYLGATLAHHIAYETAGGKEHWLNTPPGAYFVQAAAHWAHEMLISEAQTPGKQLNSAQNQELLRLAVRNGRVSPLEHLWFSYSFKGSSYPEMIQTTSRYVDLNSVKAQAVIDYIADTYGKQTIPKLLRALGRHDSLDATLQEALGIGLQEFEPAWLTWLGTHYGFGKGWRFAEAVAYWEQTKGYFLIFDNAGYRHYQELMRTAVQYERVLPLTELWNEGALQGRKGIRSTANVDNTAETNALLGRDAASSFAAYAPDYPDISSAEQAALSQPEDAGREFMPAITVFTEDRTSAQYPILPSGARTLTDGVSGTGSSVLRIGYPDTWRGAHSLALIRYIHQVYGGQTVYKFLAAIVKNDTLDDALRRAIGMGLDQFEPGWHTWLEKQFANG